MKKIVKFFQNIFNKSRELSFEEELKRYQSWQAFDEPRPESNKLKGGADSDPESMAEAIEMLRDGQKYYWAQHYQTLSDELKSQIDDGTHASLLHESESEAKKVLAEFSQSLTESCALPLTQQPTLEFYHGNQLVFSLRVDSSLPWSEIDSHIPSYYLGFRVMRLRESDYKVQQAKRSK